MERWYGKAALVTGASSGIGAAVAEKLVEVGVQVVGIGRRVENIENLSKTLSHHPGKLHPYKTDVLKEEEILDVIKWTFDNVGPIHILINSAGLMDSSSLIDGCTQYWREVLETNVLALCITTREVVKMMIVNNVDGHIVHINSIAGHYSHIGQGLYGGSKFAITCLTNTLWKEFLEADKKIKSISPGIVKTEMLMVHASHIPFEVKIGMSTLEAEDVANAVMYALGTPPGVQIHELIIKPMGEKL